MFLVAFKFPNLFRRLLQRAALTRPLFRYSKLTKERDYFAAKVFAEQAFSLLLWVLLIFVIVIEIIMPWALMVFVPGFVASPERFDLAVSLTKDHSAIFSLYILGCTGIWNFEYHWKVCSSRRDTDLVKPLTYIFSFVAS